MKISLELWKGVIVAMLLLSACAPSPETISTQTASAWTKTPVVTWTPLTTKTNTPTPEPTVSIEALKENWRHAVRTTVFAYQTNKMMLESCANGDLFMGGVYETYNFLWTVNNAQAKTLGLEPAHEQYSVQLFTISEYTMRAIQQWADKKITLDDLETIARQNETGLNMIWESMVKDMYNDGLNDAQIQELMNDAYEDFNESLS